MDNDEFRAVIDKLHSKFYVVLAPANFLDGKWYKEMSGISRSMRAMTRRLNNFKYEKRKR